MLVLLTFLVCLHTSQISAQDIKDNETWRVKQKMVIFDVIDKQKESHKNFFWYFHTSFRTKHLDLYVAVFSSGDFQIF